eukprot:gb/GEZJ01003068.1/.p1 GENE.gb/GEZJ01003068.1/~~gb/GEZJ01003068.1/.p1  ORF type:complete len:838 (-),score=153.99 gb/GEZJ01003068.1/:2652-5165(-)
MDGSAFVKGFKNIRNGVIRTAERASVEVRKAVGISNLSLPESFPEYDHLSVEFKAQTKNLDTLHHDALSAYEAIQRSTGTAYTLAAKLRDSLSSNSTRAPYLAADALVNVQASIVDDVLPRVERRVKKRVIDPTKIELNRARQINHHMEERKRCYVDAARYHERVSDGSASPEDVRKADDKMAELTQRSNELVTTMSETIKRRATLIESIVAETIEFQRRFYVDSARSMERAIDVIGANKLATMRGATDEIPERRNSVNSTASQPEPPQSVSQPPPKRSATLPVHNQSIWNELDDEDDGDDDDDDDIYNPRPKSNVYTENIFDDPLPSQPEPETSRRSEHGSASDSSSGIANPFGRDRSSTSYPSNGIGKRESSYPSGGVGQKESFSSYPTGASRTRDKYPRSRTRTAAKPPPAPTSSFAPSSSRESNSEKSKPSRISEPGADLLGFDTPAPPKPTRSRRSPSPPSSNNTEDLLDLGGIPESSSTQRPTMRKSSSSSAMEGDLLGDLGAAPQPRPRSSTQSRSRRSVPQQSFSAPTMNANSKPSTKSAASAKPSPSSIPKEDELLQREQLRKKHENEIKARADEKLAAVRERERAHAKEREDKDVARSAAERKINGWTGNGTRRGNLRALLASLDTVLYPTATWKPVSMDVLKENSRVKVNYHKAILQVHPDKISSKNLSPDHLVLAELVFDELKNGYEVWTAECEGRPPPPGSVGPKNAQNQNPGFGGMGGMAGMYNMGGMGRTGMGSMGGMGMGGMGGMGRGNMGRSGMGRGSMGGMGMGGMGMGGMGNMGMGNMGMGGRGMGGMGMGGMGGMGRRGAGMGGMPQTYGRGMNSKR